MKKTLALFLSFVLIFTLSGCNLISKNSEPSLDAAEDLIDDGDIEEALDMLEDLIDEDEEDFEAWELLVQAYIEDEAFDDAAEALEDMAEVIEENYDADDEDIEDAMDLYTELAEEIMDEDDDISIDSIYSIIDMDNDHETEENDDDTDVQDSDENQDSDEQDDSNEDDSDTNNDPMTPFSLDIGNIENQLQSGDAYYKILESGELVGIMVADEQELLDDFMVDFSTNEDEIIDTIQDSLNESMLLISAFLGLEIEVEVLDYQRNGDIAHVTLMFSDFEIMMMNGWYGTLNEFADYNDDYESLATMYNFVDYTSGNQLPNIQQYGDLFVAYLDSQDGTAYYEVPGRIIGIDDYVDYEVIADNIIRLEPYASGYMIIDADLEYESIEDLMDMDFDFDYEEDPVEAGDPNNLQLGQRHIIYNQDGSYTMHAYITADDFEWDYDADFTTDPSEINDAIVRYYNDWYGAEVEVMDISANSEGIMFTATISDVTDIDYYYGYTLSEEVEWYDSYEAYFEYYDMVYFDTSQPVNPIDDLAAYGYAYIAYISDYSNGAYFTFPGEIIAVDDYMNWVQVDSRTIFIGDWSGGIVIYEP